MVKYKMSKVMARAYLGDKIKGFPQDKLCEIINEEFGLLQKCCEVVVY